MQLKVTAFCTRGAGAATSLLVFHHPTAGVQVPAGTVEPGEGLEAAALRELREETGVEGRVVRILGERVYDLPAGRAVLLGDLELLARPAAQAPRTGWRLANVAVDVVEESNGFLRVVYLERDFEDAAFIHVRVEGWLPAETLAFRQRRAFYHLAPTVDTPARWRHLADGFRAFEALWTPLAPRPRLVAGQNEWLAEFYDALLESAADAEA